MGLGIVLVVLALYDTWVTIYHKDLDGPLTHRLQLWIWSLMHAVAIRWHRARRTVLSFAGPVMMVATFALWVVLFTVGFTLIVWPNLGHYQAQEGFGELGFIDALYYTGVTATVLGYGDITPLTPATKIMTVLISGTGFLVVTAGITYLVSVVNGVSNRNSLALRVRAGTRHTGDGVLLVEELIRRSGMADARDRLETLSASLREIQERFHQFPILDLFYRSRQPAHDPEPMLHSFAEAALAARLVAQKDDSIVPEAYDLEDSITDIMWLLARQQMPRGVYGAMLDPETAESDRKNLEACRRRLDERLGGSHDPGEREAEILTFIARTRIFFKGLDRLTSWRKGLPESPLSPSE